MKMLSDQLIEITGMDAITLQPAAGAHGELTGILLVRAYLESQGNPRKKILIPDSAHGTNPATAAMCGYAGGEPEVERRRAWSTWRSLEAQVNEDVAALMLTNPNTLGVFEQEIHKIADMLHAKGALLYMDGANMNALVRQGASRRLRRRRHAPQPAQDVLDAARRRRSRLRPGGLQEDSRAVPADARGRHAMPTARWASTTTVRSPSAACACSTATSACSCARWPTSWPTAPTACARPPKTRCSTPTTSARSCEGVYDLPYKTPTMHEVVFSDQHAGEEGHQDRRHRQAADRLRLPSVHRQLPAGRSRRADDRADRERIEGRARPVHRRHEADRGRGGELAGDHRSRRRTTRASRAWTKPPPPASRSCAGSHRPRKKPKKPRS